MSELALNLALAAAIGDVDPSRLHLVQLGSARSTGSVTIHAWLTGDRHARWVAKAARDPRHEGSLQREWATVRSLLQRPDLQALIPAARARFTCAGTEYFVYDGAAGRTMYAHYRNRIFRSRGAMLRRFAGQAFAALVRVHESGTSPAQGLALADDLRADLDWLVRRLPAFPVTVAERVRGVAERIELWREPLPFGQIHGDFSPYNILVRRVGATDPAAVRVIDWEHAEPVRPQSLDVLRFMAAGALMGLRGTARAAALHDLHRRDRVLEQALLGRWFDAMTESGAAHWLAPPRLEALWCHFLVHAARREAERSGSPADWTQSTYVAALAAFTAAAGSVRATRVRSAAAAARAWTHGDAYRPR
jgi:hypothetical protein